MKWVPFFSLMLRETRRFLKVIYQTIVTPLISTALYLLIFGVSIGSQIDKIGQFSYLAFLVPGLVTMGTLRNAFDNAAGSIITAKFCGELEDLKIVPLSPLQICWANGLAALFRGLIVGSITLIIGSLFFLVENGELLSIAHPVPLLFFLALGGFSFGNLGLTVAMFSKSFEEVNAINTFILLPLIYLGGVFFSLDQLHPFWQALSKLNPLLYLVNGVRYGILGMSEVSLGLSSLVAFSTFCLFQATAIWSLKKGSYHRW